jgi:hypothetical protein
VAWERDNKVFYEIKVHVVSLVLSLIFKTVFGMFLAHLVCLKSVKLEMPGSFQSLHKEYSDTMLWKSSGSFFKLPEDFQIFRFSDFQIFRFSDFQIFRFSDFHKKNWPINSKTDIKNWLSELHGFKNPCVYLKKISTFLLLFCVIFKKKLKPSKKIFWAKSSTTSFITIVKIQHKKKSKKSETMSLNLNPYLFSNGASQIYIILIAFLG